MAALLRLLAIIPPEPLYAMVRVEQQRIADTWGPRHALRTPPHMTLIPPLSLDMREAYLLEELGAGIAQSHTTFNLRLRGYGAFPPRVVFMKPLPSGEMESLHRNWRTRLEEIMPHVLVKYPEKPYRPHMTLAHKDVTQEQFNAIWDYYGERRLDITFKVRSYALLEHAADGWHVRKTFPLGRGAGG